MKEDLFATPKARLIFGASNDIPSQMEMKDLKAFYERFIIRIESQYVPCGFGRKGPHGRQKTSCWQRGGNRRASSLRAGYDVEKTPVEQVSCLNDVLFCTRAVTELWGGENIESPEMGGILQPYHELVTRISGGPEPDMRNRRPKIRQAHDGVESARPFCQKRSAGFGRPENIQAHLGRPRRQGSLGGGGRGLHRFLLNQRRKVITRQASRHWRD